MHAGKVKHAMRRHKDITVAKEMSITAVQARARVNRFLLSQIGSQFCAGEPTLDVLHEIWRVPILMVTPGLVVGEVGEAKVSLNTRAIESHTSAEQIYAAAEELRKRRHAAIKAAFIQAGKR
jgi:hypothetical protein